MLIKDGAIVLTILVAGVLIYAAFPGHGATTANTQNDPQLNNNLTAQHTTMPEQVKGLTIEVIKEGSGAGAQKGQSITVDYTGKLVDGTVFDSSIPRGEPFTITLGIGQVIPGWDLGLAGMKVGEERKLTIAPELAYGASGIGGVIPPNATLIFDVTLKAIK